MSMIFFDGFNDTLDSGFWTTTGTVAGSTTTVSTSEGRAVRTGPRSLILRNRPYLGLGVKNTTYIYLN